MTSLALQSEASPSPTWQPRDLQRPPTIHPLPAESLPMAGGITRLPRKGPHDGSRTGQRMGACWLLSSLSSVLVRMMRKLLEPGSPPSPCRLSAVCFIFVDDLTLSHCRIIHPVVNNWWRRHRRLPTTGKEDSRLPARSALEKSFCTS
jgi:hypothetical protein